MMELKDLEKLFKLCRKQGVKSLQMGDLKLEIDLAEGPKDGPLPATESPLTGPNGMPLTDEEILFFSSQSNS